MAWWMALVGLTSACHGGGERLHQPDPAGLTVSVVDARNLRIAAAAPIGRVAIAGLEEGFDFLTLPGDRPNEVRVRVLTGRSPFRLQVDARDGWRRLGSALVPNPRGGDHP